MFVESHMALVFDAPTVIFLAWTALYLPLIGWLGWKHLKSGKPLAPKLRTFRLGVLMLLVSALLAVAAAQSNGIDLPLHFSLFDVLYGLGIAAVLVMWVRHGWKKATNNEAQRQRIRLLFTPNTRAEYMLAVVGGLCAGVGEELVYRDVLFQLVSRLTTSFWAALLVSILLFSAAHMAQGLHATITIACLGLLFQTLYLISGNLVMPMVVHGLYDVAFFTMLYNVREERQPVAVEANRAGAQP